MARVIRYVAKARGWHTGTLFLGWHGNRSRGEQSTCFSFAFVRPLGTIRGQTGKVAAALRSTTHPAGSLRPLKSGAGKTQNLCVLVSLPPTHPPTWEMAAMLLVLRSAQCACADILSQISLSIDVMLSRDLVSKKEKSERWKDSYPSQTTQEGGGWGRGVGNVCLLDCGGWKWEPMLCFKMDSSLIVLLSTLSFFLVSLFFVFFLLLFLF